MLSFQLQSLMSCASQNVCLVLAEVVEYACNLAVDLRGEFIENVSSGMDTYSIRQPLGVRSRLGIALPSCSVAAMPYRECLPL